MIKMPAENVVDEMNSEDPLIPMGMGIDKHAVLYRTQDRVIRAIHAPYADFYRGLLNDSVVQKLMADGLLIGAEEAQLSLDGYPLVLEHRRLPLVSYPFEWAPSMFKDAALALLELNLRLWPRGYGTQDAHLWNVLFDGVRPTFVDFTSVVRLPHDGRWPIQEQFLQYCYYPLQLMHAGFPTVARTLMREILSYPDVGLIRRLGLRNSFQVEPLYKRLLRAAVGRLPVPMRRPLRNVVRNVWKPTRSGSFDKTQGCRELERLQSAVQSLDVRPKNARWSTYYCGENELPIYDGSLESLRGLRTATPKHVAIARFFDRLRPRSVIDLGCNRGVFSQLAAMEGARVVGVDTDEAALDQMYRDSVSLSTGAIPLFVNAVAPSEAVGFKEIPFPSVTDRLQAEGVLCLALVHHLVFGVTRMKFPHIARVIASYAKKWAVVEFIPPEDRHIQSFLCPEINWYSLENLMGALHEYFHTIEKFESFPSPRVLLLCSK